MTPDIEDFEDDLDLASQYDRLYEQHIYYRHLLDIYQRYGDLAPALERFSALCGGLIHSVGNGLNTIQSCLGCLALRELPVEGEQHITRAQALCQCCGWRLYTLAEVSPALPLFLTPIDLPVWLEKTLASLDACRPPETVLKFEAALPHLSTPDYGYRLRLALTELVLNAFAAVAQQPWGEVTVLMHGPEQGVVRVEVIDNGRGLPAPDPEACFDLRFTTGPHAYGLGLPAARHILEKHGGTLILETRPTGGTRAIMGIPTSAPQVAVTGDRERMLAVEALHDAVAAQKQAATALRQTLTPAGEPLEQLAVLLGQLSLSVVDFIEANLARIRQEVRPLLVQLDESGRQDAELLLDKCDYCDWVLGNARALDPARLRQPAAVDLNGVIARAIQLMTWRTRTGAKISFIPTVSLPPVLAEPELITTVWLNLLRNALDAAGPGGSVEISTVSAEAEARAVIRNTGARIPLEAQAQIFALDYTTRSDREFGLGLYVARKVLGDKIVVRTTPEADTEFELRFGLAEV